MKRASEESDSDIDSVQEEQENSETQLENSFIQNCDEGKSLPHFKYLKQIPGAIQQMFIIFSFYQEDLHSLAAENNFKISISLNKIKISFQSDSQNFEDCISKVNKYRERIKYVEFSHQNKFKIFSSPYFKQRGQKKKIKMVRFSNKIYCHSIHLSEKDLKQEMTNLFSGQFIFSVLIKTFKAKDKQIYNNYRQFINKIKKHHQNQFKDREVVVEIDTTLNNIFCIGTSQRNLVAVKNIIKNILQSTAILVIKFENPQQVQKKVTELKTYSKSICTYPVYVGIVQKSIITLISKQNMIRKFLEKTKVQSILKLSNRTDVGMFLPRNYNFNQRKSLVEEICTKNGYDFTTLGGIYHYFKKMFIQENQVADPKQVLSVIKQVLEAIKQNKVRSDIPQNFKNLPSPKKVVHEVTQGQFYCPGENISEDLNLSKLLKRTVLKQSLKMSKPALIKYKLCESKEQEGIYWFINEQNQKVECRPQQMINKKYFYGGKIKKQEGQTHYFFQYRYQNI